MDAEDRQKGADAGVGTRRVAWRVGELAERTGLSVRALHHYEEIGLLVPSGRTGAGHRLYSAEEALRLQRIASLRALGFSLGEIRGCLDDPRFSPARVIRLHLARLRERIGLETKLYDRLEAVASRLNSAEETSAEGFVETVMEVTRMSENVERHYAPEQLEALERRRRELGEGRIRAVEAEWPELMRRVRAEMEAGTDPADERVQRLAGRWTELVEEFTGGDPGVRRSLGEVWRQEETVHGIDTARMREMTEYVSRAMAASDRTNREE